MNLKDESFAIKVPGILSSSCPSTISDLTSVKTDLTNQINSMFASGDTYIPAGLTWGKRLLSNVAPYSTAVTNATAIAEDTKRAIVLMTDGENQRSAEVPGNATHWGSDIDQANDWTTEVCNNIKNDDVILYTVTFGTALDADIKTLVEDCATSPGHYFHAVTAADLVEAFADVSEQLTGLYLSK